MSFRTLVRRAIDAALTGAWGAERWVAGSALAPGLAWRSTGRERVLVLAPHPDDEVAGCGATLTLHRRAGDQITICYITDGRRSRSAGLDGDAMARRRHAEARESAATLGARFEWVGLREGEWVPGDLVAPLDRLMNETQPTMIYAPSRVDFHPEHYKVALAAAEVLRRPTRPRNLEVRVYQVQVPLTRALVNLVTPGLPVLNEMRHLSAIYGSQEGSLRACLRLRQYAARAHHLPGIAEEFWAIPASSYAALHAEEPPRPLVETFRGLRRLPWTDPLAFRVGAAERRRLARLAVPSS